MKPELIDLLRSEVIELSPLIQQWREHLHQFPEPSFQEFQTMEFVARILSEYGISFEKDVCGTGLVALISSDRASGTIGLRADLDALPIQEKNDVPYKSKNPGWMHACGHDVHTAILLGVAVILQKHQLKLTKSVKLIFQPGEEMNPGGASLMIKAGVLENPNVESLYALHVYPEMESGNIGLKSGLYMASSDEIHIEITGKGGHGALPQNCVNPLFMGSELLMELSNYIKNHTPIEIPTVINFGRFEALGSTNIVPEKALIKGTFRTMNSQWREEAFVKMGEIVQKVANKYGGSIELKRSKGYPNLENNPNLTKKVQVLFSEVFGENHVKELDVRMTAEDFAFYAEKVPICFFRLGVGNSAKGITNSVHHPNFDIDPAALYTGVLAMSTIPFSYGL
jgi:amidohydrolase